MAGKMFKILVYEGREEPTVEVNVPLKLAKWALRLLPVVQGEIKKHADIDVDALRGLLDEGFNELEEMEPFDLVKVNEKDERVLISIQ